MSVLMSRIEAGSSPWPRRLLLLWALTLLVLIALLAFVNLPYAPRTWFDEGSHLHVPKTIVQDGRYADKSAEGFRYHGPTVAVGPTVMLPIALVFQVAGIDLLQARLVIVAYLLLALLGGYLLARRLYGPVVGLLAVTFLLASRSSGYDGIIEYGRQVLGEVPGVAFMFFGLLAWVIGVQAQAYRWRWAVLAGISFGLALITKNQFALILPPALVLLGLLDWRYYHRTDWFFRIVPLVLTVGLLALWMGIQLVFLGPGTLLENIEVTRQVAGGSIFVFNEHSTLRAGAYILRPDLFGSLLLPALLYTLWRARQRDAQGLIEAFIGLIIGLWLAWFVFASLGWPRYAFPVVALSAITIARMAVDLINYLRQTAGWPRVVAGIAVLYLATILAVPLSGTFNRVLTFNDDPQRFAAYMDANVPRDALVATWEQELGFLTDHRYQYPPQLLLDRAVRAQWLGGGVPSYDWHSAAPQYVVIGDFGGYTGIYHTPELDRDYREIHRVGPYVLFQRR